MHPAVVRASKIANRAVAQGWTGSLDSQVVGLENDKVRKTVLFLNRNDEQLVILWRNTHLDISTYSLFGHVEYTNDMRQIKKYIMGWPDLVWMLAMLPEMNGPSLVEKYRRLPFDMNDSDDDIIDSLLGKRIWWYNRELSKIESDVVKPKRDKRFRIQHVGHRKMMHCMCVETNFRSVLLDSLIQVA